MIGKDGDADTGPHLDVHPVDIDRTFDQVGDLGGHLFGAALGGIGGEDDGELIAAQAGDGVGFAQVLAQPGRDL